MGVALGLMVAACPSSTPAPAAGQPRTGPQGPRPVQVAAVRIGPYRQRVEVPGEVVAVNRAAIAARVDGALVDVRVEVGDHVRTGQTLARIEATDFDARKRQAEADLTLARAELARLEQLQATHMSTARELDQARAKVASTEASLELAERALRDVTVRAPFDGVVSRRDVSRGSFVRVGASLFEIVSDERRVAIELPERYVSQVGLGASVNVQADDDATHTATVVVTSPVVTSATRAMHVEASLAADAPWRPGTFVRATLTLREIPDAARVPKSAVFQTLGRDRVVVVEDGRAEPKEITWLGDDGADAVISGVSANAVVVTRNAPSLAPGSAVVPAGESSGSPR